MKVLIVEEIKKNFFYNINENNLRVARYNGVCVESTKIGKYDLEIRPYSPPEVKIDRQFNNLKYNSNSFSVSLLMEINDIMIFFSSDIEKNAIDSIIEGNTAIKEIENGIKKGNRDLSKLYSKFPPKLNYLKIPHHGSKSSQSFFKLLTKYDDKVEIVCTTKKSANGLPFDEILEEYEDYAENVYCTCKNNSDKKDDNCKNQTNPNKGVIKTQIDIDNLCYIVKRYCE